MRFHPHLPALLSTPRCAWLALKLLLGCDRPRQAWVDDLRDPDSFVRLMATAALAEAAPHEVRSLIPVMIQLLGDEQIDVRNRAAACLLRQADAAILPLVNALSEDGSLGASTPLALDLLASFGSAAQGPLLTTLEAGRSANPRSISEALGNLGSDALDGLLPLLGHADPQVRRWSAHAIGVIGPAAARARPALLHALEDDQPRVREEAVRAAGKLGKLDSEVYESLFARFLDEDPIVRQEAASAVVAGVIASPATLDRAGRDEALRHLGALGSNGAAAVDPWLYQDRPEDARRAAILLSRLGDPAISVLVAALCDRECPHRGLVLPAVVSLGRRAVPQLIEALAWSQSSSKNAAARALESIGPAAVEAIPALTLSLDDPDEQVRDQAARSLTAIAGDQD